MSDKNKPFQLAQLATPPACTAQEYLSGEVGGRICHVENQTLFAKLNPEAAAEYLKPTTIYQNSPNYPWVEKTNAAELPRCPTSMSASGNGATASQGNFYKNGDGTGNCR